MTDAKESERLKLLNSPDQPSTNITSRGLFLIHLATGIYFLMDGVRSIIVPQYIYERMLRTSPLYANISKSNWSVCDVNTSDPVYQAKEEAQENAARWRLYTSLTDSLIEIGACVVLGSNSDRFGRRWLFVLSNMGVCVKMLTYAANSYWALPMWTVLFGHFFNGLTGGSTATFLAAMLCVVDATGANQKRSLLLICVGSMAGIMASVSDIGSGYIIKYLGFPGTFLLVACIAVLNFITLYALPETSPRLVDKLSIADCVKNMFAFYVQKTPFRHIYLIALFTFFTANIVLSGREGILTLYCINLPFCWDSVKIGVVSGIYDLVQPITAIVCVKVLQKCLSDSGIGAVGTILASAAFVTTALATKDIHLYIAGGLRSSVFFIGEMVRAILSKLIPPHQQGVALSSLAAVEVIVTLCGGLLFNSIYEVTVKQHRGFVYFVMLAIMCLATSGFVTLDILIRRQSTHVMRINFSERSH